MNKRIRTKTTIYNMHHSLGSSPIQTAICITKRFLNMNLGRTYPVFYGTLWYYTNVPIIFGMLILRTF
jgi:hypothetical protein